MNNDNLAPVSAEAKEALLKSSFSSFGAVAIAYSGGVDSSYLADVAHETLGGHAHLVIADSPSIPRDELTFAVDLAQQRHWRLKIVNTREFDNKDFRANDGSRCYHCKAELFSVLGRYAEAHGISTLVHGETAEDGDDPTRVGVRAAREARVKAPLAEAGFTKDDIRERSRARGLPTWDKPSFACLASRLPKGAPIEPEVLSRIEQAEALVRGLGFRQYRARHHGDLCRIEVAGEDIPRMAQADIRQQVVDGLRALGYRYVTLDLAGYRMGSTAG